MDTVILVVDDSSENLALAQKILGKKYRIAAANSGMAAFKYLERNKPDLILLDINMPEMDGFQAMDQLQKIEAYSSIPVIFLTADKSAQTETLCFQKGAVDFVSKPFIPDVLMSRVDRILQLQRYSTSLESMVAEKTVQVERITLQAITAIANTIDAKDEYTKGHSVRVADYSELIAKELGWSEEEIQNLKYTALLHDIGKIGVPDSVLNKPGKLTEVEAKLIRSHTSIGGEILKDIVMINHLADGATYHHERYDGRGYPEGIAGEEIPLIARIICVADSYDAMSSDRVYRKRLTNEAIEEQLVLGRGTQFDPGVLDVFLKLLRAKKVTCHQEKKPSEQTFAEQSHLLFERVISEMDQQRENDVEIDYLTGLLTRRSGEKNINAAMHQDSGCLAFIDMDNLKLVNDVYGHLMGDYALKTVGSVLLEQQEDAIRVRYGGDEFLYYLRGMDRTEAEQRILKLIQDFKNKKENDEVLSNTSLSIGLCTHQKDESYEIILQNADRAAYHVKQKGKGGYYFHVPEDTNRHNESATDLNKLMEALQKEGSHKGALNVKYREFIKIYDFVKNLSNRYEYPIQIMMITARCNGNGREWELERQERLMECVRNAIKDSLRGADVTTRFSSDQYLVILVNAEQSHITMIIDRIFQKLYKSYEDKDADVSYDVAELRTK